MARTGKRRDGRAKALSWAAFASALLVLPALCVTFLTTTSAAADPVDQCTTTEGALVAVDFGPFGGTVERGCDTTVTTGYDLLHDAGFTTTGTQHDGAGFICRIGFGPFDSGKQYPTPGNEDCVQTPQADAYWSYWIASPDQDDWTYSPYGAQSRNLKNGDVDAWVYGGTEVGGSGGEPGFSPDDIRSGHLPTPDPDTPTGPAGKIDVTAAATWLRTRLTDGERIVDDGSTTPNYPLTTDTAYALAAADGENATLDKITGFLAAHVADFAYPNGTGQDPDATAVARLALLAEITGRDAHAFGGHDLLATLTKNVCAAGPESGEATPGCTAKGDFRAAGYTEGQAMSVLALLRAEITPPATAVDRLTQLQCKDDGVTSILIRPGENCEGEPATTALVALVLRKAGGHDDAVTKARDYLARTQRQDGAFPATTSSTTGDVISTAYAAQALRDLGDTARADAAVGWLSRHQLKDGGFSYDETSTDPALYPVPPAVLAGAGSNLVTLTTKTTEPGEPPTDPPSTPAPDLKKGVAYLTKPASLKQGRYYAAAGGSTRADFGLTIDGAYALAATGLNNTKLRSIVDFIDQRGEDGEGRTVNDWTGIGTRYVAGGSLAKTALLAEAVGRDPRQFAGHDLIAALDKAVCAKASTAPDRSCAAKGAYTYAPSVFAQSLAVMAQLRAGEKSAAERPLAYLESLQHPGGAWPSLIPATGDSDVDSTAIAAMTLDLAGGADADKAVHKALAWIASRQLADGGFPGAAGDSVNSAALAVQALSLDADTYAPRIAKARKFLASQQNTDGGFNVAKEGQRGSDLRASTQAIGGATGISFGTLARSLAGTSPQPTPSPSAPDIIDTGDTGGSGGSGDTGGAGDTSGGGAAPATGDPGDGGVLASTGAQAGALAAIAVLLTLAGWRTVALARRRADAGSGR